MVIKDGTITENKEVKKRAPLQAVGEDEKELSSEIKNAHASGDGSFGRNDSSVPDEEEPIKKEDNSY